MQLNQGSIKMSDDLDQIRQKRLKELQDSANRQQQDDDVTRQRQAALEEAERQKQMILRQILTEGARSRLTNVKLVKPQLAEAIENQLIQLYQTGRVDIINEEQLLQMLKRFQDSKRESKIKFKRV
jgi:programmed cell death protein 5